MTLTMSMTMSMPMPMPERPFTVGHIRQKCQYINRHQNTRGFRLYAHVLRVFIILMDTCMYVNIFDDSTSRISPPK